MTVTELLAAPNARVVHLAACKKPWLYTLKTGQEAAYPKMGGGMAVHKSHPEKLWLLGLCAELDGRARPYREGDVENIATRNPKKVTCMGCKVALDRALEVGRVRIPKDNPRLVEIVQEYEPVPSVAVDIGKLNGWFKQVYGDSIRAEMHGLR